MGKKRKKTGFTLTELAMAIVFISILLLTIAVVTMNLVRDYHKGLTMKSINTVGLALIEEFSSAVAESPVFDAKSLCKSLGDIGTYSNTTGQWELPEGRDDPTGATTCMNDGAKEFIYQQFYDEITVTKNGHENAAVLPTSGVFCTGKYSYVWNTGYAISQLTDQHTMTSNFYSSNHDHFLNGNPAGTNPVYFRLRKYPDTGRKFCINNFPNFQNPDDPNNQLTHYPKFENGTFYLGSEDHTRSRNITNGVIDSLGESMSTTVEISSELINSSDLAIYSLTINPPTTNKNSGRSLYTGSFVLGSITGDIDLNLDATGEEGSFSSCNLENTSTFDVEYCATNKFNFAMRAMGGNSGS